MSNLDDLMKSGEAKELLSRRDEISRAAQSKDGRAVMEKLEKADVAGAIKRGDAAALKSAIENAVRTEEGARFLRELTAALGKKRSDG